MDRETQIVHASLFSIITNALLAAAKGIVGTLTGSIAISLDAVNSLADALSSVIALLGAKLAGRQPDREHPFGFGRVEYLSSIVIAALILAAGVSSFVEAVRSILSPSTPTYTVVTLAVVAGAALVKLGLGFFLLKKGRDLGSDALAGSGTDAVMDAGVSASTFVAGVLYMLSGIKIESWLAAAIALLIIKSGIELLIGTSSKLLGERVDPGIAAKVERAARSVEEVKLASSLVLLDFGPNRLCGAMHVTVDGNMTVAEYDSVARAVQSAVKKECDIAIVGVTPYPAVEPDESTRAIRSTIGRIVWSNDHIVELRGLYVDPETQTIRFDAVMEFCDVNPDELREEIRAACQTEYPDWTFTLRVIPDIGD